MAPASLRGASSAGPGRAGGQAGTCRHGPHTRPETAEAGNKQRGVATSRATILFTLACLVRIVSAASVGRSVGSLLHDAAPPSRASPSTACNPTVSRPAAATTRRNLAVKYAERRSYNTTSQFIIARRGAADSRRVAATSESVTSSSSSSSRGTALMRRGRTEDFCLGKGFRGVHLVPVY